MYRLVIRTKQGLKREHYYYDYDDMEYNAVFLLFSPNIESAYGQKRTIFGWKTLFTQTQQQ